MLANEDRTESMLDKLETAKEFDLDDDFLTRMLGVDHRVINSWKNQTKTPRLFNNSLMSDLIEVLKLAESKFGNKSSVSEWLDTRNKLVSNIMPKDLLIIRRFNLVKELVRRSK